MITDPKTWYGLGLGKSAYCEDGDINMQLLKKQSDQMTEYCEWVRDGVQFASSCTVKRYGYIDKYCPSCGKPIKIKGE